MLYQKVIQYFAYIALALPALPPALFPFFQPYTFGKATAFEIIVEAMALVWLIGRYRPFRTSDVRNRHRFIPRALVALALAFTASTLFSTTISASFWGSSARMDGLFTLLHFGAFFFILASSLSESAWRRCMQISVATGTFAALYAIAQWFGAPFVVASEGEVFGTLGNPSYLALYLLFSIFLAHFLAEREGKREVAILLYCAMTLQVVALLLTQVQTALFALAGGVIAASYPYIRARITLSRSIIAIGVVGALFLLFSFNTNFSKLASLSEGGEALSNRMAVWNIALSGIAQKPFFGHGANNFESYYLTQKNKRTVLLPATGETFDKPHNTYLEIAFSYGLIGLLAYLFFVWVIVRRAWRVPALRGAFTSYFVFLFFFFDTFASLLIFFFAAAFLFSFSSNEKSESAVLEKPSSPFLLIVSGIALVALFLTFHFKPLYSAYFARQFLIRASTAHTSNEATKAKALQYHSFNAPFIERAILLAERAMKKE